MIAGCLFVSLFIPVIITLAFFVILNFNIHVIIVGLTVYNSVIPCVRRKAAASVLIIATDNTCFYPGMIQKHFKYCRVVITNTAFLHHGTLYRITSVEIIDQ